VKVREVIKRIEADRVRENRTHGSKGESGNGLA
jgi:hypothetical protein